MKNSLLILLSVFALLHAASCRKPEPEPLVPPPPVQEQELITTVKLEMTDSASSEKVIYTFSDPDGPGGTAAFYGPAGGNQSDSVIVLDADRTYFTRLWLLNDSKQPADTISFEVEEEGADHMVFYNAGSNTVLNDGMPYTVKLSGSNILIVYQDADQGSPSRGIGLQTKWYSSAATITKERLLITLKHQPGTKDGSFAPGETDIEVAFGLQVQ